jgi:hypothetical protein
MYSEDMYSILNCHNVAKHTRVLSGICKMFQKELYNDIPNVTV